MNRKQFTILIVVGLIVGGLGVHLSRKDSASWKSGGEGMGVKLAGDLAVNDVTQIVVKQDKGELNLVKANDIWTVKERGGYPANFGEIKEFLSKVWELKSVQKEEVGDSQLQRLELVEPGKGVGAGTAVYLKGKDGKSIRSLLLGKKHMKKGGGASPMGGGDDGWPDGRWVRVLEDAKQRDASLVTETFSQIEPKPDQWLSKEFFKVEKIKSIAVTHPEATNSWTLKRETEAGEMVLTDAREGEKLDTSKVYSQANAFASASFNDVVVGEAKPDQTGLDKPIVAKIETFDHFLYTIKVGKGSGEENFHMTVAVDASLPKDREPGKDEKKEDKDRLDKEFKDKLEKQKEKLTKEKELEKWVFVTSKWTVEPVQKARKDLLVEKKDPAAADAAKDAMPKIPGLAPQ